MNILFYVFIIYLILIIVSPIRYIYVLPTLCIYPNNETEVLQIEKETNMTLIFFI